MPKPRQVIVGLPDDTGIVEAPPTGSRTGKWIMGYGELVK
jgi:hypothetical protein